MTIELSHILIIVQIFAGLFSLLTPIGIGVAVIQLWLNRKDKQQEVFEKYKEGVQIQIGKIDANSRETNSKFELFAQNSNNFQEQTSIRLAELDDSLKKNNAVTSQLASSYKDIHSYLVQMNSFLEPLSQKIQTQTNIPTSKKRQNRK
jgi:hypothetical protein